METPEFTLQAMYQYCNVGACRECDAAIKKGADPVTANKNLDKFIDELKGCTRDELTTWFILYYEKFKTKIKL